MSVNKDNMRTWVKALRSGDFTQTKGRLSDGEGHCCLGVVCEVASIPKVVHKDGVVEYDQSEYTLPRSAVKWLGIEPKSYENPRNFHLRDGDGKAMACADWNDGKKYTFDQIADLIENTFSL